MNNRLKTEVVRTGDRIFVKLKFDDADLCERIVMCGDLQAAEMVEAGELRITADSHLVYADGSAYRPKRSR